MKGWRETFLMMVEGDKWEVYIPAEMAYGDKGVPQKGIPPVSLFLIGYYLVSYAVCSLTDTPLFVPRSMLLSLSKWNSWSLNAPLFLHQ
jgi:hypothetical protein